jgi:hypothetical protein
MKFLVNLVQVVVVTAMIYPFFLMWDKNNVDHFCDLIEPGITKLELIYKTDHAPVKFIKPSMEDNKGRWSATVETFSPFSDYHCQIRGIGSTVAEAWIVEKPSE